MIDHCYRSNRTSKGFQHKHLVSNSTNKKRSFWVLSLKVEGRIMNIIFTPRRLIEGLILPISPIKCISAENIQTKNLGQPTQLGNCPESCRNSKIVEKYKSLLFDYSAGKATKAFAT